MPATHAVKATAVARKEARASLERLDYHLGRGAKGAKGVAREVRFLDALHTQTVRQTGIAVGKTIDAKAIKPLGQKAVSSLSSGSAADIGRMKSSILADFSADALQIPREEAAALGSWKWTANASACPSCLDRHGQVYKLALFTPLHPSCLCIPQPVNTPGLRPLSDSELVSMAEQYGSPRYSSKLAQFKDGTISRSELSGVEAVNTTPKGLGAVGQHLAKGEVSQTGLPGGISDDIVKKGPGPADPDKVASTYDHYAPGGKWDPERLKLHDDIVKKFIDDADEFVGQGEFHVMGGGPASGKSTMLESDGITVPRGRRAIQIDPDEIKKMLPEYAEMEAAGDLRAAAFAHNESSIISKKILKASAENGKKHVVLDGTGDKGVDDVIAKVQALKDKGYKVKANYATNDPDLAWKLAQDRAEKTGRHVPEHVLRETHADVSKTFFDALERRVFDEADLWDTNTYLKPARVASWRNGKLTIHDEKLLDDFFQKAHNPVSVDDIKVRFGITGETTPTLPVGPDREVVKTLNEKYAKHRGEVLNRAGLTEDEFIAIWNDAIKEADVITSMSQTVLDAVIKDGRVKSQFETQISGGTLDPKFRATQESKMFGYAEDLAPVERPIYGWSGNASEYGSANSYGRVNVVWNEAARENATFTLGDSLSAFQVPSQVDAFSIDIIDWQTLARTVHNYDERVTLKGGVEHVPEYLARSYRDALDLLSNPNLQDPRFGYVETQIHNGAAKVENIKEVVFRSPPGAQAQATLDQAGISWRLATDAGSGPGGF